MAGIEYLNTKAVAELIGCTPRVARGVMKAVGLIHIGHGVIRRDALDRYMSMNMDRTFYTAPLMDEPIKPKYDRYARTTGGRKHAAV